MQSKTSFFNRTIFRKNLTRYWPLWGLTSFIGALFPLAMLVNLLHSSHGMSALEIREIYYHVLVYAVPVVSIVYAILCALTVWNYLYNARSVGMMHTLPIRRDSLYFTNVISGMTMMAIPYAVTGALVVLVSLAAGGFDAIGTLVTIGGVICDSVFFFGLATLCAMVVGNIVALPLLYGLLNFIAVLTDWMISMLAEGFIFGITGSFSGAVNWLSPVVYLMSKVEACSNYEEMKALDEGMAQYYYTSKLTDVTLQNGYVIALYGLVGLVLLGAAFCIYRKRRSESAGDVISVGVLKPVFCYGMAAYAAVLGGRLLYAMFVEAAFSRSGDRYLAVPMAVCMFVAGAIGYYIARMILAKSARVFNKRSLMGLAAVAVGCAALCAVMNFDVFGVGRRVPALDKINTLTMEVAGNRYTLNGKTERDAALIEAIRDVHAVIVDQQDTIMDRQEMGWWDEELSHQWVTLNYQLKSGVRVVRQYRLFFSRNAITQPGTFEYALDQLVNGTAMRQRRIHADDGATVTGGWINFYNGSGCDLSSRQAEKLLAALSEDAAEGTWGTYQWFDRDYAESYAMNLDLEFELPMGGENDRRYDSINLTIWPEMRHTVAKMLELDLVTEQELITVREYEERQDRGYYDKDPYEEFAYSEMATETVIGGADAPATVVVG